ncbi:MAG: radical SAM protein [Clostridia bacterium]|nr:radical SAM protein [Clostridia bacterium]
MIDPRYRLRGWHKLPTGLYDAQKHEAQFFAPDLYKLLLKCDAAHDIDPDTLPEKQRKFLEKLQAEHIIHPAGWLDFLLPEQRYKAYPARYRQDAHWSITGECNLRCRHCFMSAPSGKHGNPSHEEILRIADMLAECGVFRVGITGGEPLIRSDFTQILDALKEREIALTILYTNGWLVDEKLLDTLEERGMHPSFQLSFDGVGWHDFLRGIPGAEERTLKALRLLNERGYKTSVSMCVHRKNAHTIRESINLLASLGVTAVKCGSMMNLGEWAKDDVKDLQLSRAEEQAIFEAYIPQYFEDDAPVSIMLSGAFMYTPGEDRWVIYNERKCDEKDEAEALSCGVLAHSFHISAEGLVCPCMGMADCDFAEHFPTLKSMTLSEILTDSELIRYEYTTVRDVRDGSGKCRTCRFVDRCAGGCRNAALMAGDNYYGVDPDLCAFFENGWDQRIRDAAQPAFEAYLKRNPPVKGNQADKGSSILEAPC